MKISAMHWVVFTTLLLIIITIFSTMDFSFSWIFYLSIIGQASVVIMVYKVLRDNYKTNQTFKDLYRDRPDLAKK